MEVQSARASRKYSDSSHPWNDIEDKIQQILQFDYDPTLDANDVISNHSAISLNDYMGIYSKIYEYCSRPNEATVSKGVFYAGRDVFDKLRACLNRHLLHVLDKITHESHSNSDLIRIYAQKWGSYLIASRFIDHLFHYLNRHWIPRMINSGERDVYYINVLALVCWRNVVFDSLKDRLNLSLLELIRKDRLGETVDYDLLRNTILSYVRLGLDETDQNKPSINLYQTTFEQAFLHETVEFYQEESDMFISRHPVMDYLKRIGTIFSEEKKRIDKYLHESSTSRLILTCENVLIAKHVDLMWKEFIPLLEQERLEDIQLLYQTLVRLQHGLDPIQKQFEAWVCQYGLKTIESVSDSFEKNPRLYVEKLTDIYEKFKLILKHGLSDNPGFHDSLDKACRECFNKNSVCLTSLGKSAELFAKYCDSVLEKSSGMREETSIELIMDRFFVLFKYLDDKDVFQKFYSKMLSRRLISANSISDDVELYVISKLREICGYDYTSRLQRMLTDMSISRELSQKFSRYLVETQIPCVEFQAMVLSAGSWLLQSAAIPVNLPNELQNTTQLFLKFYDKQHSGRKLDWLYHLSRGEIQATFSDGISYTFQVSTYQMMILVQYNDGDVFTFNELMTRTQLDQDILSQILIGFLKLGLLILDHEHVSMDTSSMAIEKLTLSTYHTKDFHPLSQFSLNVNYRSKRLKVNLNIDLDVEQNVQPEETQKTVEEDRKLLIQASIVRIMKAHRLLKHVVLVNEVINQLQSRFQPKISDIKHGIDLLIEKEYIQRVEGDKDTLSYIV